MLIRRWPVSPTVRERLPADVEVAAVPSFDDAEFARVAADATVLVNARRPIGAAQLVAARSVRLIQAIGVGIDAVDLDAAAAAGVTSPTTRASTGPAPRSTR